ncbi:hypothetical protein KI387_037685, partial [Taxus chinensis]
TRTFPFLHCIANIVPSTKAVTISRSGTFTLDVLYADPSQVQAPQRISSYTVHIVCNVHHDEFKPLSHVSSKFRDA